MITLTGQEKSLEAFIDTTSHVGIHNFSIIGAPLLTRIL
jgi:hypothetical protein